MWHLNLITTCVIKPTKAISSHDQRPRIELTPSDLQYLKGHYIQKGLLFPKPDRTSFNIYLLKTSLAQTLDIFYPLAGRLVMIQNDDVDNTKSFFVDCNGAGANFWHSTLDSVKVNDFLNHPVYIPDDVVYSYLFPTNGLPNYDRFNCGPLLEVHVTELVNGVFVALSMNHAVADESTLWSFFNTWSEISRRHGRDAGGSGGGEVLFGREYLNGVIDLPIQIVDFDPNNIPRRVVPKLRQRVFRFDKENISKLKAKANDEVGTTKISSLQALLAHLWVTITRNQNLNGDEEVCYDVMIDLRHGKEALLTEGYFGNAVITETIKTTAGELDKNGLGWAAWEINRVVASQTKERAHRFFEDWAKSPKLLDDVRPGHRLVIGGSIQFDVYGNDFGWGKPVAVRSGIGNEIDGEVIVFSGSENGSIDIEVCLRPDTLDAMDCDKKFLETLATTRHFCFIL